MIWHQHTADNLARLDNILIGITSFKSPKMSHSNSLNHVVPIPPKALKFLLGEFSLVGYPGNPIMELVEQRWNSYDGDDDYFFNKDDGCGGIIQEKLAIERLPIAKVYHPFICGPDSQRVRDLMERTGVKIVVPPHSVDKDEIVVSGEKEGVLEAKRFILAIYEEKVITLLQTGDVFCV